MNKRSALALTLPALALAALTAGCGGSESAETPAATATARQSAAGEWPARVVCDEHDSFAFTMSIQNLLPVAVTPAAKDIDCADWSGVSTPPTAFNNSTIPAGQTRSYRLEPRTNYDRNWTMQIAPEGMKATQLRMAIPTSSVGYNKITASAPGATRETIGRKSIGDLDTRCTLVPLGPTGAPNTPPDSIRAGDGAVARTVSLIVRKGQATLVTDCIPNKGGDAG